MFISTEAARLGGATDTGRSPQHLFALHILLRRKFISGIHILQLVK